MAILLLSTEACHLCELAQEVLQTVFSQEKMQRMMQQNQYEIFLQDIIDDGDLINRYGEKIPVLLDEDTHSTLEWPFDAAAVITWFEGMSDAGSAISK